MKLNNIVLLPIFLAFCITNACWPGPLNIVSKSNVFDNYIKIIPNPDFASEVNRVKQHAVGTTAPQQVHKIQKSLSYSDLKKEIEHLLPIGRPSEEGNPRKRVVEGRRLSKTFRHYPQILIHPPDESLTSSLPDINANLDKHQLIINNVSDKNVSCPDLTDQNLYNDSIAFTTNFKKRKRKTTLSKRSNDETSKKKQLKRKRKKKGETHGEVLKKNWKFKHFLSMHNLKSNITQIGSDENNYYDNYHTVHGGFGNIEMFAFDDNLDSRTNSTEVIYKCCCKRRRCDAAVPIQQYLETYFINKRAR